MLLSSDAGNTVADRIQTNCTILFPFFCPLFHSVLALLPFFPPLTLTSSLHGVSTGLAERDSDFCVVEPLFLFVPFSPRLPAHRLAAPCVKGGCSRTDCGNSRLASPGPLLPNQRGSHQSSAPPVPCTHKCPTKHTLTHKKSLQHSHPLPIIHESNFISKRVAAPCRQPLQSFLINSRFVPHPSFWTHLSYIPIGAAPSTPRQPPFANPTASPRPAAPPQGTLTAFFLSNLPITYLQSKVGALTPWVF